MLNAHCGQDFPSWPCLSEGRFTITIAYACGEPSSGCRFAYPCGSLHPPVHSMRRRFDTFGRRWPSGVSVVFCSVMFAGGNVVSLPPEAGRTAWVLWAVGVGASLHSAPLALRAFCRVVCVRSSRVLAERLAVAAVGATEFVRFGRTTSSRGRLQMSAASSGARTIWPSSTAMSLAAIHAPAPSMSFATSGQA